jgi:hypothetical protein
LCAGSLKKSPLSTVDGERGSDQLDMFCYTLISFWHNNAL